MYSFFNGQGTQQRKTALCPDDGEVYDEFKGRTIVVDLANINGSTEEFEGRQWLETRVNARQPIGWMISWTKERARDTDNPVALMQFADDSTALLIRTHRTRNWLPSAVVRALQSEVCRKVCASFEKIEQLKMEYTFNFFPLNIEELPELAKKKGLQERSLRALAERFGLSLRKDLRTARSNWALDELSDDQIRFAAEEVHFTFRVYSELKAMPDPLVTETEGFEAVNHGVLELQPGWEDQGITRRHDGLYCTFCDKGPMTVPMVVERHMESAKHKKKVDERLGVGEGPDRMEIPEEWVTQGILIGDGINGLQAGNFKCILCDQTLLFNNIEAHIKSKKHIKHTSAPGTAEGAEPTAESGKQALAEHVWNLPDYVGVTEEPAVLLQCSLCTPPVNVDNVQSMLLHLGGDRHAKKCAQLGYAALLYNRRKGWVEELESGKPCVRANHKVPKRSKSSSNPTSGESKQQAESTLAGATMGSTADVVEATGSPVGTTTSATDEEAANTPMRPLPEGWTAYLDPESMCPFYWHSPTDQVQWDFPEELDPSPPQKQQTPCAKTGVSSSDSTRRTHQESQQQQSQMQHHMRPNLQQQLQSQADSQPQAHDHPPTQLQQAQQEQEPPQQPQQQQGQQQNRITQVQSQPYECPEAQQQHEQQRQQDEQPQQQQQSQEVQQPPQQQQHQQPKLEQENHDKEQTYQQQQKQKGQPEKNHVQQHHQPHSQQPPQQHQESQSQHREHQQQHRQQSARDAVHKEAAPIRGIQRSDAACSPCDATSSNMLPCPGSAADMSPGDAFHHQSDLPPGWMTVNCDDGQCYYADIEEQVAQWEPPPAYKHADWTRSIDPEGRAVWSRSDPRGCGRGVSFYELDPSGAWERLVDQAGKVFWICRSTGERFFEVYPV